MKVGVFCNDRMAPMFPLLGIQVLQQSVIDLQSLVPQLKWIDEVSLHFGDKQRLMED